MAQHSLSSPVGRWILLVTILASGMAFLDTTVVYLALPTIQKALSADISGLQWLVNAYTLTLASFLLIGGALGDRFGRRFVFTTGIVLFSVASIFCGLSHSIVQLAIARAIQGLGAALMIPGSLAIINANFVEETRGQAIGLWAGYSGGIAALGPFVGGWLIQQFNWQAIFFINVILGIAALFLALRFMPETHRQEKRTIDWLGTFFITLGLAGLCFSLIEQPALGWLHPYILASFIAGALSTLVFFFVEGRVKEPMVPYEIFKKPAVIGANLVTLFLYFALNGVFFFVVLNLQQIQGYSPIVASLGLLPFTLLVTFLSGYGGKVADRIGARWPMIVGALVVSIGMTLLALPGRQASLFVFLPGLVLFGLGMAAVIAPLTKSALSVALSYSGAASGVNNGIARVASLLAIAVLGLVMTSLFTASLNRSLAGSSLRTETQQIVRAQAQKLTGLTAPDSATTSEKQFVDITVKDSFIYGYHWTMGINAALALLSAFIAFLTIRSPKSNKSD